MKLTLNETICIAEQDLSVLANDIPDKATSQMPERSDF
jgi:hypothetical protein